MLWHVYPSYIYCQLLRQLFFATKIYLFCLKTLQQVCRFMCRFITEPRGALVKGTGLNLYGLMLNHKHRRYCLWFLVWLLEGWKALQQGWNWEKKWKGRGSENIPVISNCRLLSLLTKFWEVSKCPFSCFDLCFCRCHWGLLSWGER